MRDSEAAAHAAQHAAVCQAPHPGAVAAGHSYPGPARDSDAAPAAHAHRLQTPRTGRGKPGRLRTVYTRSKSLSGFNAAGLRPPATAGESSQADACIREHRTAGS